MNNEKAHDVIRRLFDEGGFSYTLVNHGPTRTSQDSAQARAAGGFPNAVGAKALIVKCEFRDGREAYATLVLPSKYRIDGRTVRSSIPGLRKFRFLNPAEMHDVVQLAPGCMPPFGPRVFETISALYIDPRLTEYSEVGFNAARMETSLVVACADYLRIADPTALVPLTNGDLTERGEDNGK